MPPENIQRFKITYKNYADLDDTTLVELYLSIDVNNYADIPISTTEIPAWLTEFTLFINNVESTDYNIYALIKIQFVSANPSYPFNTPEDLDASSIWFNDADDTMGIWSDSANNINVNIDGFPLINSFYIEKVEFPTDNSCFLENTKILTDKGYIKIQDLQEGQLVKTTRNGYISIYKMIKFNYINRPENKSPNNLFICSKDNFPNIIEDLYITGYHSLLVDKLLPEEKYNVRNLLGDIYITDNKFRLPICLDKRAKMANINNNVTLYHIILEHKDDYVNYGIWANGILVESCPKNKLNE